jgi:HK97 family phage major capsid protein
LLGTSNINQVIYNATNFPANVGGKLRSILEAIKDIEENGKLFPDAMIMSPGAYEALAGQVDGNNNFMLGAAAQSGSPTIWGVPVVKSTQIGTAMSQNADVIVGKFGGGLAVNHVFRRGMELQISDSAKDGDFGKDILTVKASLRYASAVYKPQAFTKVEGIE